MGEGQESVEHFPLTFLAFPGFWGVEFRAFQETTESWKARKAEIIPRFTGKCGKPRHSWLSWRAKKVWAFLESQETPGFPGFSLCAKKRGKPGNFPWNSAEFLAHFCRGYFPNTVEQQLIINIKIQRKLTLTLGLDNNFLKKLRHFSLFKMIFNLIF